MRVPFGRRRPPQGDPRGSGPRRAAAVRAPGPAAAGEGPCGDVDGAAPGPDADGVAPSRVEGPIPLHPEAVEGDPAALRWVTPPGLVQARGTIRVAPGEFGAMIADGRLASVEAAPDGVTIRLARGTWREHGEAVRRALTEALRCPERWSGGAASVTDADTALAEAARAVLVGPAGDYVRSHGGRIDLVDARDGSVTVRLSGACGHCAAATATLAFRVERELREAYPDLVELRRV